MKTFLKVLLAILVGIGLSACRVDPDPDEGEEPTVEELDIDHEHEIIDALEVDPYWNEVLEEDVDIVFERVLKTCTEIEDGLLITDVILDMMGDGISRLSAEHMVEVAIFIVCPEFESNYEAYILSNRQ